MTNVGGFVEINTTGGFLNWSSYFGKHFGTILKKLLNCTYSLAQISTTRQYPQKIKETGKELMLTKIFMAPFSLVAKNCKVRGAQQLSTAEQVTVHDFMEYYGVIKNGG